MPHSLTMDHTSGLSHPPRGHARAASRASVSTASTRMTSNSYGSANTSFSASPKLPHPSMLPHRPYTTTGTRPQLKDSPILDAHSPMSSFLHEKLQRERRADMDARSVSSGKLPPPSTFRDLDPRINHQSSPIRSEHAARPPSSNGSADSRRKKGMGAKEMEQTVSTLHKQNFDLKLELYHRRERQTALEDRLEGIRREKAQVEEMNDTLLAELEKRDKAVEEAVGMIVLLEARVETLLQEREMVRHIESGSSAFRRLRYDDLEAARGETPRPRAPSASSADADASTRAVHHVPSFVSFRSGDTENLRNVYLGTHGSLLSLPQPHDDRDRSASVASPSLSVLSESSFLSVYGRARDEGRPSIDESLSELRAAQPSRTAKREPRSASRQPGVSSIAAAVGHSSPLQKLERTFSLSAGGPRHPKPDTPEVRPEPPSAARKTKEQKREALRRVLTDAPRVSDAGLPPTPDTISTTTLRRCKNSDDTLGRPSVQPEGARLDLPPLLQQPKPAPTDAGAQVAPVALSRQPFFDAAPIARPASACETTSSRVDDWDSDDNDARSAASSDIWMREGSWKPRGRESPDLFGFPASMGAWAGKRQGEDLTEVISVQAGLLPCGGPPPPPNRRSSLHAPTGSTGEGVETPRRKRHARRNSDGVAEAQQYPPTAQAGRPRGLGRLNPFRRSLTAEPKEALAPAPAPVNEPASGPGRSGSMGMPSWIKSGDDDRPSATPPPIMRNRGQSVGWDDDGGVALGAPEEPAPPRSAGVSVGTGVGAGGGEGRRKWLGGFRRDSRRAG